MATTKITDLTAYTDPVNTDVLPIVDVTSDVTKKVSIANVMKNASLGTAALPGIAFDGDPNTGIYSPSADQVAVTTGGTQRLLIDSSGAVTIAGDLTVNGTTTNINTQNLVVEDKNIVLGDVATPTDVTADGGGITLKGTTDKTINWVDATDAWTSSERFSYPTGSAAAPTLTFTGDTNTGIYSPGADQVSVATGGTERLRIDSTGQIEAVSLGTAAAPTFTFTGDPDTGVYSPGANQLAISTNGQGRLFVDANGQVGVNTVSPNAIFTVNGGGAAMRYRTGTAVDGRFEFAYNTTDVGYIGLPDSTTFSVFARTGNALQLGAGGSERLRITSAGLVGVGTSSPVLPLTVAGAIAVGGAGNNGIQFYNASPTATALRWLIANNQGDSDKLSIYRYDSSGNFAGTPLVIDSSNRVGIGTSSPSARLDIAADSGDHMRFIGRGATDYSDIVFYSSANTTRLGYIDFANTQARINVEANVPFRLYTNAQERLTVTAAGNVGIGTTSPQALIDLNHATGSDFRLSVGGVTQTNFFASSFNTTLATTTANPLIFGINSTERARIDSSGRLLVGTSSARSAWDNTLIGSNLLQVERGIDGGNTSISICANAGTSSPTDTGAFLYLGKTRGTTVGSTTAVGATDCLGRVSFQGSDGTEQVEAARVEAFVDGTPGANNMPGRIILSTTAAGASSPTERMRVTNDGVIGYNQAAPVAVDATATLTVANLKNGIITSTTAAAVTGTLPTGTLTEGGFSGLYTNFTFEWTVINTGATNNFTVAAGTDHTVVGNMVVTAGNSGRFATRRTAANTFVTYRLSS